MSKRVVITAAVCWPLTIVAFVVGVYAVMEAAARESAISYGIVVAVSGKYVEVEVETAPLYVDPVTTERYRVRWKGDEPPVVGAKVPVLSSWDSGDPVSAGSYPDSRPLIWKMTWAVIGLLAIAPVVAAFTDRRARRPF